MASSAKSSAKSKLEEAFAQGPSSFNAPIPYGGTVPTEPSSVYRTYWETVQATGSQFLETTPFASALNRVIINGFEDEGSRKGRPKLSPEEANQLYPNMGRPFTEPVDPEVLGWLGSRDERIQELQAVIDGGNKGTLASGSRLALQFAMGIFDPINAATGFGIGRAIGVGGRLLGSRALMFDAAATGGRAFARDVLQGAAGNVAAEPLYAGLSSGMHDAYDPSSVMKSAFLGAAIGAAPYALRGVKNFASPRLRALMGSAKKADAIAAQAAVSKMNSDRVVESGRVVQDVAQERIGPATGERQILAKPGDYNGKSFYHPAEMQNDRLATTMGAVIDRDYGPGVYLTDSPDVANGYAASKYSDGPGGVFEVKLTKENPNILDLGQEFPDKARAALEERGSKWGVDAKTEMQGKTGQQILNQISEAVAEGKLPPTALAEVSQSLEAAGYDGYRFDGESGKHNVLMMFDREDSGNAQGKVQEVTRYSPNQEAVPSHTVQDLEAEIERQSSIQSHALYDAPSHEKIEQLVKVPLAEIELPQVKESLQSVNEELEIARKEGRVTPEMEAELSAIEETVRAGDEEDKIVKAALHCMTRKQ